MHHPVRGRDPGEGLGQCLKGGGPRRPLRCPQELSSIVFKDLWHQPEAQAPGPEHSALATSLLSSCPWLPGTSAAPWEDQRIPGDRGQPGAVRTDAGPELEPSGRWVGRQADARGREPPRTSCGLRVQQLDRSGFRQGDPGGHGHPPAAAGCLASVCVWGGGAARPPGHALPDHAHQPSQATPT